MTKSTVRKNYAVIALVLFAAALLSLFSAPNGAYAVGDAVQSVYVGGTPIGLAIKPAGVIVVGAAQIETDLGNVTPSTPLLPGDIIEGIDGKDIFSAEDIQNTIAETEKMSVTLKIKRGTASLDMTINLIREDLTGEKRLGLRVRESVSGVGTVTYILPDGSFAALGHPILLENGSPVSCHNGYSFDCKILGINKGARGRAGELKGAFTSGTPSGTLYKNQNSGVYGKFDAVNNEGRSLMEVAPAKSVTPGKAQIISTIGESPETYDIEIVKTMAKSSQNDKSMIVRVTDKRLIAATGGIVQGMSGSPIIQNGKIVGAVTHVFISDPTKGYGIYAENMLENM